MLACSSPQITADSSILSSTSSTTPTVTHVLCCPTPNCSFMSLQASLMASHAYEMHRLLALRIYRCTLCGAASTQWDLMREHAEIYHQGFEDCNMFGMLATQVLSGVPMATTDGRTLLAGTAVALVGSKKRKSTVPERVRCHTVFPEAEAAAPMAGVDEAPQTPKVKKPRKALSLGCVMDEARSINKMLQLTLDHQNEPRLQIGAPEYLKIQETELLGESEFSESALDLSMKSPMALQTPKSHRILTQPLQQQQQLQQKPKHKKESPFGAAITQLHLAQQQLEHQKPLEHDEQLLQQRQNFTSGQNARLLQWFIEHKSRPYPSADDTKVLALATGLSYSQVKKWFANKRMRSKAASAGTSSQHGGNEEGTSSALSPAGEVDCPDETLPVC